MCTLVDQGDRKENPPLQAPGGLRSGDAQLLRRRDREGPGTPLPVPQEDALYDLGDKILTRHCITFDNEGCYGEIGLDVETGQVEVEVNIRYIETELETHQSGQAFPELLEKVVKALIKGEMKEEEV
jgi:hypothetical protein